MRELAEETEVRQALRGGRGRGHVLTLSPEPWLAGLLLPKVTLAFLPQHLA